MDDRLDVRARTRVAGPSWRTLQPEFVRINDALLAVSPTARGSLTTVYVKYVDESEAGPQPYAVVWIKKSSELVVGLSLPEGFSALGLSLEKEGYKYAKLNGYLVVTAANPTPDAFQEWAERAYESTRGRFGTNSGRA
jgi:hypothetical protein